MNNRYRCVSVIGSGDCTAKEAEYAQRIGELLAEHGIAVICGGRGGVMESVCRGAFQNGGLTIGILPGQSRDEGNAYLSLAIPTSLSQARNLLVVLAGEVVIAVGGGYGTLSEIGFARKNGLRVIGLATWDAKSGSGYRYDIDRVEKPEEAVGLVLETLNQTR